MKISQNFVAFSEFLNFKRQFANFAYLLQHVGPAIFDQVGMDLELDLPKYPWQFYFYRR